MVLCKNEKFGNWNLGYEMKKKVRNVELLKADLDRIDDDDIEILETPTCPAASGFDEMDEFK